MAYRLFAATHSRRLFTGAVTIGTLTYAGKNFNIYAESNNAKISPAEVQFTTASQYPVPTGWSGHTFRLRYDYPGSNLDAGTASALPPLPGPDKPLEGLDPAADAPWLKIDFTKDPKKYAEMVKEYCWEGNVGNDFDVFKNTIRDWYHAPWMHYSDNGREPIHGLTFERPTPPLELSKTQDRYLQTWACGFYNSAGATVFGQAWANPDDPQWKTNLKFPNGTCVFKILMTDASDTEIPTMVGAPSMQAVIADPTKNNGPNGNPLYSGKVRNNFASDLRLLQADWAVRDDRAPIGWVFGTFMYDGSQKDKNPWDRVIPVGVMWGNDPTLTQEEYNEGMKPTQSWIYPLADDIRESLGGKRTWWGWLGRLNGPADNYMSACSSCHSTGERSRTDTTHTSMVPDGSKPSIYWFRNIPAGEPFTQDGNHVSSDYSLQFMMGYYNYLAWRETQKSMFARALTGTKYIVPSSTERKRLETIEAKRQALRAGPELFYDERDQHPEPK